MSAEEDRHRWLLVMQRKEKRKRRFLRKLCTELSLVEHRARAAKKRALRIRHHFAGVMTSVSDEEEFDLRGVVGDKYIGDWCPRVVRKLVPPCKG